MAEDKPITEGMHMTIVSALDEGGVLPSSLKYMTRKSLLNRGLIEQDGDVYRVTAAGRKAVGGAPDAGESSSTLERDDLAKDEVKPAKAKRGRKPKAQPAEPAADEVAAEANEDARLADQAAHEVELNEAERAVEIDPAAINGNGKAHGPASLPQSVRDALSAIRGGRLGSQARNVAARMPQRDGEADTRYVGRLRHEMYVSGSNAGGDALQLVPA